MQFLLERKEKISDTAYMPPFNLGDNGKMDSTEKTGQSSLIVSQMRTAYGRDVIVYYDPETTMTLVYDYVPGRSLIFEGQLVDDFFPEKGKEALVGCFVENHMLSEMSVQDIWADVKNRQQK